jgi:P pilus assembly chaperone PapD
MKKLLVIFIIAFSCKIVAQGDLLVTPSRVVFEGSTQKEVLNLVNMGNETTTYSVSFVQRAMKEDGSFIEIAQPELGQNFADPYLRIFPRQVTLAAQESQAIVLQYRRKPDMRPGEYRSHLYFRSEKNYIPLGDTKTAKDAKSLSVQLIPIFGMSIPVIIRTGETEVTASLTDLQLESKDQTKQNLSFNINRTGNISLFGDIRVQFIPEKGKAYDVAAVNGVGVYTTINSRKMTVRLDSNTGELLNKGKLQVTYRSNGATKAVVYAATDLLIEK